MHYASEHGRKYMSLDLSVFIHRDSPHYDTLTWSDAFQIRVMAVRLYLFIKSNIGIAVWLVLCHWGPSFTAPLWPHSRDAIQQNIDMQGTKYERHNNMFYTFLTHLSFHVIHDIPILSKSMSCLSSLFKQRNTQINILSHAYTHILHYAV